MGECSLGSCEEITTKSGSPQQNSRDICNKHVDIHVLSKQSMVFM